MSKLFHNLPIGAFHLESFLDVMEQMALVQFSRDLLASHPLMQPMTKTGHPLSLKVSSWGKAGWFGLDGKYSYIEKHKNGRTWPEIPLMIRRVVRDALTSTCMADEDADNFSIDTCLLNWYPAKTGKLGRHQDVTEEDQVSPIVTISLGDSCVFNIGSEDFTDKGVDITCESGDVLVMAGESRLAYHGVKKVLPGTDRNKIVKTGGRISLTARKIWI